MWTTSVLCLEEEKTADPWRHLDELLCSLVSAEEDPIPFLALAEGMIYDNDYSLLEIYCRCPSLAVGWPALAKTLSEGLFFKYPSWIVLSHPFQQAHSVYFSCI